MKTNVQSFIDAGEIFDIAVKEGRLLHFNGGQAVIRMWDNENVLMIIDFTAQHEVKVELSINAQYVENYKHSGQEYKKRYNDWLYKAHLTDHFTKFSTEEEKVA